MVIFCKFARAQFQNHENTIQKFTDATRKGAKIHHIQQKVSQHQK
jgi:hypothetical protein